MDREVMVSRTKEAASRRVAVFGVANQDSIAWHVVRDLKAQGNAVYIGYQQRFRSRVLQLVKELEPPADGIHRCDLTDAEELRDFVACVGAPVHGIVHSVAFAPASTFGKPVQDIEPAEFEQTLSVSCYSLIRTIQALRPILSDDASVIAMTYIGSQRVVPGYRLMGIAKAALEAAIRELAAELGPAGVRVNAISAGPLRTLSASAIPRLEEMLEQYRQLVPLRRCIVGSDIARAARFLLSPESRAITGQVLHVDCGFSITTVPEHAG
jgi:enoyl-[acyl-carrier protein] reductase I